MTTPRNVKRRPVRGGARQEAGGPVESELRPIGRHLSDADDNEPMSDELVLGWHENLMGDEEWLAPLLARGITESVLRDRLVGIEVPRHDAPNKYRYTIPDPGPDGQLRNVKKYAPGAPSKKNIHTRGYGGSRLMGVDWLAEADPVTDTIWVVGGEPDFLRAWSAGLFAVTGTSGEGSPPKNGDLEYMRGFRVVICLDQDKAGRAGAAKWVAALLPIAASVKNIEWPAGQGTDLTDFVNNGHTVDELHAMATAAPALADTQRPLDDLLAKALEKAETEGRNNTGIWLACQVRDERYSRATAERFMAEEYVPEAAQMGEGDYTVKEALDSVEQAYSLPPRQPSGLGPLATAGVGEAIEDDPEFRDAILRMNYSDTGNAQRLKLMYADRARYCPAFRGWLIWDGRYWKRDASLEIMRLAKNVVSALTRAAVTLPDTQRSDVLKWCLSSESQSKLDAMVKNAQSELTITPNELDTDHYKFNCENGTVDLRTGELHAHDPDDLITMMAPVEHDPDATNKRWEEVLDKFVRPDEGKEAFLGRAAFESLTGTTSSKAFMNLYDDNNGDTGKTTFLESLLAAWGPYGAVVNAESFLTKPNGAPGIRADLADCAGKRLVVSSETPTGRKLDTALLKKLTAGSGAFQFERKYENPWTGTVTFTVWIDGNSVAKANAEDNPLFNRWRLTPFTHKIARTKVDRRWVERAAASPEFRAAVLAWAMRYRAEWTRDGIGTAPVVEAAVEEVREAMDPLGEFWEVRCEFGTHTPADRYFATTDQLMDEYERWVMPKTGVRPVGREVLIALLKRHPVVNGTGRVDGSVVRGWKGVRVKPIPRLIGSRR